jgi:hypothetical protein
MSAAEHTETPGQYEFPPAWVQTVGEAPEGIIVEQGEIHAPYGDYPVVTIRLLEPQTLTVGRKIDGKFKTWTDDFAAGDLITIHIKSTALLHQYVELRPKDGERYWVTYRGMTPNGKGESTHRFKSALPDRPSSINFDKYARKLGIEPDVEPSGYGKAPVSDVPDTVQFDGPPAHGDEDIPF